MDAFFLIHKPSGQTSFDVLRDMRRILWVKKIGHTGTLDPLATGCLLVAVWNYTKLISLIEKDTKSYRATIQLNGTSPSYDSDTDIEYISQEKQEYFRDTLQKTDIESCLKKYFLWEIKQIPPKYSAIKIRGKRALDRMLAGEDLVLQERSATILSSNIISYSYPELIVEFTVSAGTYIRSIAHDLGNYLWTGGYLSALERSSVWHLTLESAVELSQLSENKRLDVSALFQGRIYELQDEDIYRRLAHGQRVRAKLPIPENTQSILSDGEYIRYIIEYTDGVIHPRKKIT